MRCRAISPQLCLRHARRSFLRHARRLCLRHARRLCLRHARWLCLLASHCSTTTKVQVEWVAKIGIAPVDHRPILPVRLAPAYFSAQCLSTSQLSRVSIDGRRIRVFRHSLQGSQPIDRRNGRVLEHDGGGDDLIDGLALGIVDVNFPAETIFSQCHDVQRGMPLCVCFCEYFHNALPQFVNYFKQSAYPGTPVHWRP